MEIARPSSVEIVEKGRKKNCRSFQSIFHGFSTHVWWCGENDLCPQHHIYMFLVESGDDFEETFYAKKQKTKWEKNGTHKNGKSTKNVKGTKGTHKTESIDLKKKSTTNQQQHDKINSMFDMFFTEYVIFAHFLLWHIKNLLAQGVFFIFFLLFFFPLTNLYFLSFLHRLIFFCFTIRCPKHTNDGFLFCICRHKGNIQIHWGEQLQSKNFQICL